MSFEVIMPKMGESIVEGTIIEWKKKVGDFVAKDEILLEISTDKVDSEIPSSHEGTLLKVLYNKNDAVEVGKVIALIGDASENTEVKLESSLEKDINILDDTKDIDIKVGVQKKDIENHKDLSIKENTEDKKTHYNKFFSPLVKAIAKKENIDLRDLEKIPGSGLNGRINKNDILRYVQDSSSVDKSVEKIENVLDVENIESDNVEKIDHVRKMISEHMLKSLKTSAHVYSSVEVDVTSIVEYVKLNKESFQKNHEVRLTYTPFFLEACIEGLQKFPLINSSFADNTIYYHKNINLGVAVALPDNNLIVPVIKHAEEKNFLGLLKSTVRLASKARNGKLSPEDVAGSTFTLTNPGIFGSLFGMGIINQPNVAILSTGSIEKKPVVKETEYGDAVFIRNIMYLTLGYDHRIIDGAYGSKFLVFIKRYLESINLDRDM